MQKLSTIQKRGILNDVYAEDEIVPGGAYHSYVILETCADAETTEVYLEIDFQKGPRCEPNSTPGVMNEDLLEIVRHRLQCFQKGDFATRENACALTHIEEALFWLNKRVEDRIERKVFGTYEK